MFNYSVIKTEQASDPPDRKDPNWLEKVHSSHKRVKISSDLTERERLRQEGLAFLADQLHAVVDCEDSDPRLPGRVGIKDLILEEIFRYGKVSNCQT